MKHYNFLTYIFLILVCISCAVGDGDDDDNSTEPPTAGPPSTETQTSFTLTASTDENGAATVNFGVAPGVNKFSITADPNNTSSQVRFASLTDSNGTDYIQSGPSSLSLADNFGSFVKTAVVPPRNVEPTASSNVTYTATLQNSSRAGGETISVRIDGSTDSDLESGGLTLNIFFVGDAALSQNDQTAISSAINTASATFSSAGISGLRVNTFSIGGPINLPSPLAGSSLYSDATNAAPSPSVNIFIGGSVGGAGILGFAADIPGAPFPSERSVTAVSIFESAGPDGVFSEIDTRLLGETIVHEAGHFMGLFHPIDFSGVSVQFTDPLDDTASCSFITECLSNSDLIRNFMYPSPVSDGAGSFVEQNIVTSNQRSVLNRYLAVD